MTWFFVRCRLFNSVFCSSFNFFEVFSCSHFLKLIKIECVWLLKHRASTTQITIIYVMKLVRLAIDESYTKEILSSSSSVLKQHLILVLYCCIVLNTLYCIIQCWIFISWAQPKLLEEIRNILYWSIKEGGAKNEYEHVAFLYTTNLCYEIKL